VRVAAIDCGTNSTRLLVAEQSAAPRGFDIVDRRMRITRLGQGVSATKMLAAEAIERTAVVLREYRGVLDELGVEKVRITATSAARDAANREDFFSVAHGIVGVEPELLSGAEEARLSFLGATSELDPRDGPFAVVDIGGGSTEFIVGTTEPEASLSVDIGCVRITEQELHHDPPQPEELSIALSIIDAHLDDVDREVPGTATARTFVGLAGTITTVAAVEMGLAEYDRERIHHFRLTRAAAEDVFRTLATESRSARIANPGLEVERADVIVGGCCILVSVFQHWGFEECLVSEADILDGLALSLLPHPFLQ
jgi:exopolyphosphatase/guanosine-5'-triphosphate,3'-diphosphate pyrophosphatase